MVRPHRSSATSTVSRADSPIESLSRNSSRRPLRQTGVRAEYSLGPPQHGSPAMPAATLSALPALASRLAQTPRSGVAEWALSAGRSVQRVSPPPAPPSRRAVQQAPASDAAGGCLEPDLALSAPNGLADWRRRSRDECWLAAQEHGNRAITENELGGAAQHHLHDSAVPKGADEEQIEVAFA